MKFGFVIPTRPPLATTENIVAMLAKAEELGFAYVTVPDHIIPPGEFKHAYPYAASGEMSWGPSGNVLEMLALLSFLAGKTSRIRIATGIMVVPLRNPLFAAKALATIDFLSNGRLTVGCGVGWEHLEFAALGAPAFSERGQVADEYIRLFKELWTKDSPKFAGRYANFADLPFYPKPVQRPHPPIWVGGESPPAMRRAARLGNGWYPIGSNQRYPYDTIKRFSAAVRRFNRQVEEAGRNRSELELAYCVLWYAEDKAVILESGERKAFTGEFQQIAADVQAFKELGVSCIILNLQANTLKESLNRMERFAARVYPLSSTARA
jgi:probable F420-dependent oxidoreductase